MGDTRKACDILRHARLYLVGHYPTPWQKDTDDAYDILLDAEMTVVESAGRPRKGERPGTEGRR